jgi:3-oxoadipate enol-lactonase
MAEQYLPHSEVVGPREAPVLVLSPSLGTELSLFDALGDCLADRFRIVRYDLRGHGRSPTPPGPYSIADLGTDVLVLLDRLGVERAALCGVSIGAMASLWLAEHHPHRVSGLLACCTTACFEDEVRENYRQRADAVRAHGLDPIADGVVARWFTGEFHREQPQRVAGMRASLVSTSPEAYAGCCEALAEMDLRDELGSISADTLVISARDDEATPPAHGRAIADGVAGARFTLVDGAHLAVIESADAVGTAISRFLDEEVVAGV